MGFVKALRVAARVVGVLVGTILWIVGVPLVEFARGVRDGIRRRSSPPAPAVRAERVATTSGESRRTGFDRSRVAPIWTAEEPGSDAALETRPEASEPGSAN